MNTSLLLKMTRATWYALGTGVLLLGTSGLLRADSVEMNMPQGNYATHLGTRALKDPSGATHTSQEVKGKVVVGIFSAPNMSQGGRQEKWSDLLATQPDTKVSNDVALVLVEDMTQAGMFKGMALDSMKKQFTPNSRPFLILDEDGSVLKKFGVAHNKTVILIYDKTGKLRDAEENLDDQATTVHRVKVITKKLLAD
jgi:predicted transcriptional regulator